MYYGDKQDSLVAIMEGLQYRGWLIYGFKPNRSDSMTDYYDPARWEGIAVKNGYILVVDCYSSGKIGGSFIHQSYDAKISSKIRKLIALRDNHAASAGEKANAQSIIDLLSQKVVNEIITESGLSEVSYQKNPGNTKWHIEKNGQIVGKGTGVFSFDSIKNYGNSEIYLYKNWNDNSSRTQEWYRGESEWVENYKYLLEKRVERIKLLDKYEALLNKWDALTVIKIGDGDGDALIQKTIEKKNIYYVAEISDTPTKYVQLGKRWRKYHGLEQYHVYMQKDNTHYKLTPNRIRLNDGTHIKAYKPIPNKSTKPSYTHIGENDFVEGHVVYINLVQKEEVTEEVVWVRESKSKPKPAAKQKEGKKDIQIEPIVPQNSADDKFSNLIESGSVKDFQHTMTGEMLKVLIIKEKLGKEEFIEFNKHMIKSNIGYYSKYAGGWILKDKNLAKVA